MRSSIPFDRRAQRQRRGRYRSSSSGWNGAFGAEAATNIWGDHANLVLAKAQRRDENGFRPVRHLRSVHQTVSGSSPVASKRATTPRGSIRTANALVQPESCACAMRGIGETCVHVAIAQHMLRDEIVRNVEPGPRAARDKARDGIKNCGQLIGLEFDQLHRVLGNGTALSHDEGNRLADIGELVMGQHHRVYIEADRARGQCQGNAVAGQKGAQILIGQDRANAGKPACFGKIEASHPRMGEWASEKRRMQQT